MNDQKTFNKSIFIKYWKSLIFYTLVLTILTICYQFGWYKLILNFRDTNEKIKFFLNAFCFLSPWLTELLTLVIFGKKFVYMNYFQRAIGLFLNLTGNTIFAMFYFGRFGIGDEGILLMFLFVIQMTSFVLISFLEFAYYVWSKFKNNKLANDP
jgi:hypothetical protein